MRWVEHSGLGLSRKGGAGPSDHKAITLGGQTVMVPIFSEASSRSPYEARQVGPATAELRKNGARIMAVTVVRAPRFYGRSTAEGVPYWKIARLHSNDVLATTVLQNCMRYGHRSTSCQFCSIGSSLSQRNTVSRKTPFQLAEVAQAAVELDGVKHMVMTTGTPNDDDRGAAVLAESAAAIKAAVDLPLQAQCEPPEDFEWFKTLKEAGVDSLGMHLEAVTSEVRQRIMPGKAQVPLNRYMKAFRAAVGIFGRGQVTTYILAGLGDSAEDILQQCDELVALGVYPFVVPFVPIQGTPLESHPAPEPAWLDALLSRLATLNQQGGLSAELMKAGCGRCGACSNLRAREN